MGKEEPNPRRLGDWRSLGYRETEGEKINSMARQQEDNNNMNSINNGGFGGFKEISKINGPLAGGMNKADFQSFYGQSLIAGGSGLSLNRIHDNGDGNGGSRPMAAQVHNGIGW
ncbi:hypothetical protein CRG98_003239 [Punica granatum]|uniref:Uncharacterized protein n=1 Tax=Punica granatum TaxID=22663 RepID=A0A2I0L6J0_PUNGR|nr:hypothetical protein CRG98_003239 [Punica granatum]